jgi:hypothetical protein
MSTAAAVLSKEYFKVPNDFAEHMHFLPDAELRLSIIACRRAGLPVSDQTWENWSGRSARHKLNAVRGLQAKNLLRLDGRGNSARYFFDYEAWSHYCRTAEPTTEKPRTHGRAPSVKTPIAGPHPDCIAQGCQLARVQQNGSSPVVAINFRKPVSDSTLGTSGDDGSKQQNDATSVPLLCGRSSLVSVGKSESKAKTPAVATRFRKPVSNSGQTQGKSRRPKPTVPRTIAESEKLWPLAFLVLVRYFGQGALAYLCNLIPVLLDEFPDLTDSELAQAMETGYKARMEVGLWHKRTPDQLRQMRFNRAQAAARAAPSPPPPQTLETLLTALWIDYRASGDKLSEEAIFNLFPSTGEAPQYDAEFDRRVRAIASGAVYSRVKQEGLVPDGFPD